jgi:hypothetical protein
MLAMCVFLEKMTDWQCRTNQWLSYWSAYDAPQGVDQHPPSDYRTGYFVSVRNDVR